MNEELSERPRHGRYSRVLDYAPSLHSRRYHLAPCRSVLLRCGQDFSGSWQ